MPVVVDRGALHALIENAADLIDAQEMPDQFDARIGEVHAMGIMLDGELVWRATGVATVIAKKISDRPEHYVTRVGDE